jgi:urease subunit beta
MKPGEYFLESEDISANVGRETVSISVTNTGDRPIQVGSHYHFFETNRKLVFEREKTLGMRLNIASGTAVRFEPGQTHTVHRIWFQSSCGRKLARANKCCYRSRQSFRERSFQIEGDEKL